MVLDLSAFENGIVFPISADTSGLESGLDKTDQLLDKTDSKFSKTTKSLAEFTAAISAMTIAAGYIQTATDKIDKLNQQSTITAYSLHATTKEVTDLAVSMADAEHPVSEMSSAIDLLSRAGVGLQDIKPTISIFKDLGEVLNEDTTTVESEIIPALQAFNIEITDAGNYSYIFAHVARNTTLSVGDFAYTVQRLAPHLKTMGIGLEDVAAIFEIMASKGIQGRTAMSLFNETITAMTQKTEALKDATTKYESAVKSLNSEQENTKDITAKYNLELQYSDVGDAEGIRNLNKQYKISMAMQAYKEGKAQEEVTTTQAAVTSAQKASSGKDFYTTFSETTGITLTQDMVKGQEGVIDSNKDMISEIVAAKEQYTTETDKQGSWLEKNTLALGETTQPLQQIATVLTQIGPILAGAGGLAAIASFFGIGGGAAAGAGAAGAATAGTAAAAGAGAAGIAGMGAEAGSAGAFAAMAGTDAAETAALWGEASAMEGSLSAGSAGAMAASPESAAAISGMSAESIVGMSVAATLTAVASGALIGGIVVYALEKTGLLGLTGAGAVRSAGEAVGGAVYGAGKSFGAQVISAGSWFGNEVSGENDRAKTAEYLKTHNGQYPEGQNITYGDLIIENKDGSKTTYPGIIANTTNLKERSLTRAGFT